MRLWSYWHCSMVRGCEQHFTCRLLCIFLYVDIWYHLPFWKMYCCCWWCLALQKLHKHFWGIIRILPVGMWNTTRGTLDLGEKSACIPTRPHCKLCIPWLCHHCRMTSGTISQMKWHLFWPIIWHTFVMKYQETLSCSGTSDCAVVAVVVKKQQTSRLIMDIFGFTKAVNTHWQYYTCN